MSVTAQRLRVPLTPPQAVATTDAILWSPATATRRHGLMLAHGAGSDLTDPVLRGVARRLARRGVPTMAFAFPYARAGRRRPDPLARLEVAYADAAAVAAARMGERPLVLGGRSLGGRVASRLVAAGHRPAGLCLLGYPLHPAGCPEQLRTDHWPQLATPTLLVSGDRDRLCDLALLHRHLPQLPGPVTLHVVAGADHGFAVRRRDQREAGEVLAEVVDTVDAWLHGLADAATPERTSQPAVSA